MSGLKLLMRTCIVLVSLLFANVALAQMSSTQRDYYLEWAAEADRVERVLDSGDASNAMLDKLRGEVATYREHFFSLRNLDSARIKTLQSQLDALGPVPEEGEEPEDIAELRKSLNDQLDSLTVPRVVGEEAYSRANGLIGEIDRVIRERQASQLLMRGPTPLNPAYWAVAMRDINSAISALIKETATSWKNVGKHQKLMNDWPVIVLMMLFGTTLMVMGANWAERLGDYFRNFGGHGSGVWTFIVSLFRIALPLAGIILFCNGLSLSGMLGLRAAYLVEAIPDWGATYLIFRWIADQVSTKDNVYELEINNPQLIRELKVLVLALALVLIVHNSTLLFEQIENVSDATRAVVGFPPIVFGALILFRLQNITRYKIENEKGETEERALRPGVSRVVKTLRRAVSVLAFISPVLAAFGYLNAAEALIYPAILTLALISICLELQIFLGLVYGAISGKGREGAQDSLFVVLVGFMLTLLSLPLLAIIWGARVVDLKELWERFLAGFNIGGVQISPTQFLTFAFIFAIGYSLTRLLQGGLRNSLLPKTNIDPGGQNAIVSGTGYVGVTLAALAAITGTGLDLSSLAIVAGALSVGIGFGLQTIVSNFVSGVILLIERPISKGDWIEVGGLMGYVRDISVRSTRIETFDRTDVIVPNADLVSGTVTNYTRGNTIGRVIVPVGVAYGTDTKRVEAILREIANAHPMVLANPPPSVVFQGFGASSLDFEIRAILRDVNWVLSVKSDINHEIARRFTEEDIEIPFAQHDLWLRNPETISRISPPVAPGAENAASEDGKPDDN